MVYIAEQRGGYTQVGRLLGGQGGGQMHVHQARSQDFFWGVPLTVFVARKQKKVVTGARRQFAVVGSAGGSRGHAHNKSVFKRPRVSIAAVQY